MSDADRKIYSLNQVCKIEEKAYRKGRVDERAELLDKVMQKKRTIIDEDGVMYKVVLLKDIEDLKAEVSENANEP